MPLTLGDAPKGSSNINAPEGTHLAICYSVVDLGTQTRTGPKGTKSNREIRVGWELCEEKHEFSKDKGPEPFVVNRSYAFFTSPQSNLIQDLQAWREKDFTEEELKTFEIKKLIGKACLLQVANKVAANGKTYSNVKAVMAVPKSMKALVPAKHNPDEYYEIDSGKGTSFYALPEFLQKLIEKSKEFQALGSPAPADENPNRDMPEDMAGEEDLDKIIPKSDSDLSEIPF